VESGCVTVVTGSSSPFDFIFGITGAGVTVVFGGKLLFVTSSIQI
jgi:hypothetical protein